MFLTRDEIAELTHRVTPRAQCRALEAMRIPYAARPDGTPAVLRSVALARLGEGRQTAPPEPRLRLA